MNEVKKILFVASEANPFAGTGGLGDVIGSLPAAIAEADADADVRVCIPLYGTIKNEYRERMKKVDEFTVSLAWRSLYCGVFALKRGKVTYYFIDNEYYFKRSALYGSFDDGERYAYFCKAVMEWTKRAGFIPDILHANDWQAALCVVYQKHKYRFPNTRTVYTIHNIEYQGIYDFAILGDVFDLGPEAAEDLAYSGCINLTKGAMICADRVTTVSEEYAREIGDEYFAHGLHHAVRACAYKLSGIVNGIDCKVFDPKRDKDICANFSKSNPANKALCKADVEKVFGFSQPNAVPLVAMVSRLASHKGFDLVRHSFEDILRRDLRFVLLGTGEGELESYFEGMMRRYPDKFRVILAYNKELAKKVYAGADLFLMPSKSEPCGLAQMMACRYGTVPIVHAVGGLRDTIKPFDHTTGEGNGVTFQSYNAGDMVWAIDRALGLINDSKTRKKLVYNAMSSDFSWERSAFRYLDLYHAI